MFVTYQASINPEFFQRIRLDLGDSFLAFSQSISPSAFTPVVGSEASLSPPTPPSSHSSYTPPGVRLSHSHG